MALFNQTWTNIASQFGMPLFGVAGAKPFTGNYFWVDETNGSDGNTGGPQDPFKTLSQAQSVCTDSNNDVVFVTGSIHTTTTINWAKNWTHIIGLCDPVKRGKRARISVTGTTAFSPLLNVTGQGCWIKDIQMFHGFATDALTNSYCLYEGGGRNYYDNVEILGFGGAGTAGNTGARAMLLAGVGENTWRECVFGVDTVSRGVANYTMEISNAAGTGNPRNIFIDCDFEMYAGAATPAHIYTAAADDLDRYTEFRNCIFMNDIKSGATTINQVIDFTNTTTGGMFVMKSCIAVGATHWETTPSNDVFFDNPAINQTNPGIMLNQTT